MMIRLEFSLIFLKCKVQIREYVAFKFRALLQRVNLLKDYRARVWFRCKSSEISICRVSIRSATIWQSANSSDHFSTILSQSIRSIVDYAFILLLPRASSGRIRFIRSWPASEGPGKIRSSTPDDSSF